MQFDPDVEQQLDRIQRWCGARSKGGRVYHFARQEWGNLITELKKMRKNCISLSTDPSNVLDSNEAPES